VEKHVMKGMKLLARAIFRDSQGLTEADQLKVLKVEKRGKPSSD
jgi:hypothetical protein